MDESIRVVQEQLDNTARECLRYLCTHELTVAQNKKLAKFVFGCMNQKHDLPERVSRRGSGELSKVLKFIAAACEVLLEIEEQANKDKQQG